MMCDARLFAPQITAFSAERAVMVAPLHAADTIDALAQAVLRDAPPRFALAGLSMGGIVAMAVLRHAPDRVDRVALLDTNPLAETPERAAERAPQIERALRGELRAILRDEMKPHYLAPDSDHKTLLDLCMAMGMSLGPEVFARQSRALRARPDHTETLSHSPHPALIACGEHDTLCPLERHTVMRDLMPNATLTVIADAGHLPTLENPDATNTAMSDWLRR